MTPVPAAVAGNDVEVVGSVEVDGLGATAEALAIDVAERVAIGAPLVEENTPDDATPTTTAAVMKPDFASSPKGRP